MNAPAGLDMLLGEQKRALFEKLEKRILALYDVEALPTIGAGKKWVFECRYRRASKTLCGLYANPDALGFMLIFGEKERAAVEALRPRLSPDTLAAYDAAPCTATGNG